jgi:molecular chaperone GrpE
MNENAADQTPNAKPGAADASGPGAPAPSTERERDLEALRQERDAAQEQLKRSLADLANVRRRHAQEMQQVRATAVEALARELLPVLDNFHLALDAHEQQAAEGKTDAHGLVQGLRMVRGLFEAALERHGVREIEGQGQLFDPNRHEAVGLDTETQVPAGHVAKVLQRGYFLADKVLRPSRVLVREQADAAGATPADEV